MNGTIIALLPPVIAIIMALITKEVYTSMLTGIIVGALCATGFSLTGTLDLIIVDEYKQAQTECRHLRPAARPDNSGSSVPESLAPA